MVKTIILVASSNLVHIPHSCLAAKHFKIERDNISNLSSINTDCRNYFDKYTYYLKSAIKQHTISIILLSRAVVDFFMRWFSSLIIGCVATPN